MPIVTFQKQDGSFVNVPGFVKLSGVFKPLSAQAYGAEALVPYAEWEYATTDYSGDPYDAAALATFTRVGSADSYVVTLFYAGSDTWKLRFTPPRAGTWNFTIASPHVGLNGRTGQLSVAPNSHPTHASFLGAVGTAFAELDKDGVTWQRRLYNVYMRHGSSTSPDGWEQVGQLPSNPTTRGAQIEAVLDDVQLCGMDTVFIVGGMNWVQYPRAYNQTSTNQYPDETTFTILEDLLERARVRGMYVHVWMWNDSQAGTSSAELPGGINGTVDRRLQRYIMGRLGAWPNWSMSIGYDLEEWITAAQARTWKANLEGFNSLPRLLMAREYSTFSLGSSKLDVHSVDLRPTSGFYANARVLFNQGHNLPVIYERRFQHTRDNVWSMTTTRRAIWQFTMAGGAAGIYGTLWGPGPNYPNPEQLATIGTFWRNRFTFPLTVNTSPVDGMVLRDGNERQVVYKENTSSIQVSIPSGQTNVPIKAVRTTLAYAEVDLGTRNAGTHTISLPASGDWALAIGDFSNESEPIITRTPLSLEADPAFSLSSLSSTQQARLSTMKTLVSDKEGGSRDPYVIAARDCIWWYSHDLRTNVSAQLLAFRITGDMWFLDTIYELGQLMRSKLGYAYRGTHPSGATEGYNDGYLKWVHRTNTTVSNQGTDQREDYDYAAHATSAMMTWVLHKNRHLPSPKGYDYGEHVDYMLWYHLNHFEAKHRDRNNKSSGFPIKNWPPQLDRHLAWSQWHYYMGLLTGNGAYTNEAVRMSGVIQANLCLSGTDIGNAYVWMRNMPDIDSVYGQYLCPTTYSLFVYTMFLDYYLEGFHNWDDEHMRRLARAFTEYVVDNPNPLSNGFSDCIGGGVTRCGFPSRAGDFIRPSPFWYYNGMWCVAAPFDSTGDIRGFNATFRQRAISDGADYTRILGAEMLDAYLGNMA